MQIFQIKGGKNRGSKKAQTLDLYQDRRQMNLFGACVVLKILGLLIGFVSYGMLLVFMML